MKSYDVVIIGAGLSGIDAAYHLQKHCPNKKFVLLESRERIGGTWDLFRYPGIRSDSDMLSMGYGFRPWTKPSTISPGSEIRSYIEETAHEIGLQNKILFRHRVLKAEWNSSVSKWILQVQRQIEKGNETEPQATEAIQIETHFLISCAGYYNYLSGYQPNFPGQNKFRGKIIHPQFWPASFDHSGKRILVIGSGATAVTLVPALAKSAAHVTMLQRSPSYFASRPSNDWLAQFLQKFLPLSWAVALARWRNIALQVLFFWFARALPSDAKHFLIREVKYLLPDGFDVAKHFTPKYNPWDQRLCVVPDADFFTAINENRASIETDEIETFNESGVQLKSGKSVHADVIVTATGLELQMVGGIQFFVDGQEVDWGKSYVYKGVMFSSVPNFANVFGYFNAAWTIRADLLCHWICRLLNFMDRNQKGKVMPLISAEAQVRTEPWVSFSSGYVQRAISHLPKQGGHAPWRQNQNYFLDLKQLKFSPIEDSALQFSEAQRPIN